MEVVPLHVILMTGFLHSSTFWLSFFCSPLPFLQSLLSCPCPSQTLNMTKRTLSQAPTVTARCVWSRWTVNGSDLWAWCPPCPQVHRVTVTAFLEAPWHFLLPPLHPYRARTTSTWSWVLRNVTESRPGSRVPSWPTPGSVGKMTGWSATSGTTITPPPQGKATATCVISRPHLSLQTPWHWTPSWHMWTA